VVSDYRQRKYSSGCHFCESSAAPHALTSHYQMQKMPTLHQSYMSIDEIIRVVRVF